MNGEYILASAEILTWENLFDCKFHQWIEEIPYAATLSKRILDRTLEYTIPEAIADHVSAIFNIVEFPPQIVSRSATMTPVPEPQTSAVSSYDAHEITLATLNERYKIPNNTGSALLTQSVFSTIGLSFSQQDLRSFQLENKIHVQPAVDPYKRSINASNCDGEQCKEGNLDLQYMMGIAQITPTFFDFFSDTKGIDPVLAWCLNAVKSNTSSHTLSISFAVTEKVNILNSKLHDRAYNLL